MTGSPAKNNIAMKPPKAASNRIVESSRPMISKAAKDSVRKM